MAIKDFFHPIFRRALDVEEEQHGLHDTIVDTLQAPVDQAKKDELNAKIDAYLDTSRGDYLDRFGSWFGLSRKKDWTDDYYRDRMKKHVLHERNTIIGIRMALANFLETEIGNIQIYEPYRDMAIFNKSFYNTRAFYTSPYYRYAVIDIKVDAPIKPGIVDIINLFRPAGVLWVLTNTINGGLDAPIIDLLSPKSVSVLEEDLDYIGFTTRMALAITPDLDSANSPITNPFIYNDSDSLWNAGKVYYDIVHQNQNFTYLGQMYTDYVPGDTDTFADSRSYAEQYVTNQYTSNIKGEGQTFSLSPEQNNLVTSEASGLIKGNMSCNLQNIKRDEFKQVGGRNLLLGTTNVYQEKESGSWGQFFSANNTSDASGYYTARVWLKPAKQDANICVRIEDRKDSSKYHNDFGSTVKGGNEGYSILTILVKDTEKLVSVWITFNTRQQEKSLVGWKEPKLEKGTKATDWTPAPEDLHGIPSGSYQVGIRLQSNTSQNDTVKIIFNGTNPVTQTITADSGKDYHYYNTQVSLPDNFESDGTVTLNATNSNFKYFSIKKATNAPMYYSLKDGEEQSIYGLASAIDVQRYLMAYDNTDLTSDFSKLDNIFDYFYINLSLYSNVVNEATMYAYNFQLGLWVNFGTKSIQRGQNYLTTSLGAISPYLNSNGILFYRILFKNQNTVIVNYFGLNLGYTKEQSDPAMVESGKGVKVFTEGYSSRIDPTADGAHLYLDYSTQNLEK